MNNQHEVRTMTMTAINSSHWDWGQSFTDEEINLLSPSQILAAAESLGLPYQRTREVRENYNLYRDLMLVEFALVRYKQLPAELVVVEHPQSAGDLLLQEAQRILVCCNGTTEGDAIMMPSMLAIKCLVDFMEDPGVTGQGCAGPLVAGESRLYTVSASNQIEQKAATILAELPFYEVTRDDIVRFGGEGAYVHTRPR